MIRELRKQALLLPFIFFAGVTNCAGADWTEIDDLKQIVALRNQVSKPDFSFDSVTIVRLKDNGGQRIDATSVGPTVVGFEQGGAPAARTLFTLLHDPDRLVLFSQDVKHWKAFHKEIPVEELASGKIFGFPVVQRTGELVEQEFTVTEVIVR